MVEFDKTSAKRAFNVLAIIFIVYNIVFGAVYNIASTGIGIYLVSKQPDIELAEVYKFIYNTGFALIAAATISVAVGFLCNRKMPSFEKNKRLDLKTVIILFIIIQGMQLLCSMLLVPLEGLFSQAGYNFDEAISMASDPSVYFSSLVYSVVVAPVTEELFFRGLIMKKMEPYGKTFAIVVAALLFSLMHQNIVQMPITFAMGLLFGYITMEYSLGAAIMMHFINNAFVELSGQLRNIFEYFWAFDSLLMYFCAAATILIIVLKHNDIKEYVKNGKTDGQAAKCFFKRPLVICVIAYYLFMTLMSVSAIG